MYVLSVMWGNEAYKDNSYKVYYYTLQIVAWLFVMLFYILSFYN